MSEQDFQRFESKIYYAIDGCWYWLGGLNKDGYGCGLTINGKQERAHRLSYLIYKGSIPTGMQVCHTCDHPSCVNPDHLWLGTRDQNMADMARKGRAANNRGANNSRAKFTKEQIEDIQNANLDHTFGVAKKLAEKHGISLLSIYRIRRKTHYSNRNKL
jgi:hypothetical protein